MHCLDCFDWYNPAHRHSGLGRHTPHDGHHGLAEYRQLARTTVLATAFAVTPPSARRPPASRSARAADRRVDQPPTLLAAVPASEDVLQSTPPAQCLTSLTGSVIGGWAVGFAIAFASAAMYEWLRVTRTELLR